MPKKFQIVALVDPELRTDLDALRMLAGESRARVIERLLSAVVAKETAAVSGSMERIHTLAARAAVSFEAYVSAYAAAHQGTPYGPTLSELEGDDKVVRDQLKALKATAAKRAAKG